MDTHEHGFAGEYGVNAGSNRRERKERRAEKKLDTNFTN